MEGTRQLVYHSSMERYRGTLNDLTNPNVRQRVNQRHYTRLANAMYFWCDFTRPQLQNRIDQFGTDFDIIIFRDEKVSAGYAIPFAQVQHLFIESTLDDSRDRWVTGIRNEHLHIVGTDISLDVSAWRIPADGPEPLESTESTETENHEPVWRQIQARRGGQLFRRGMLDAHRRCQITNCDIEDLLEAAHIEPYMVNRNNSLSNGLLLRADIHTLFDVGRIGIYPNDLRIVLDDILRDSYLRDLHDTTLRTDDSPLDTDILNIRWQCYMDHSRWPG